MSPPGLDKDHAHMAEQSMVTSSNGRAINGCIVAEPPVAVVTMWPPSMRPLTARPLEDVHINRKLLPCNS